ncbi:hypothetical protein HN592_01935 [Candidatus Woesearchaeota archaeon]|jgi:hypothetical protein|nr:hypothetical protein [Candidatus Woesearchaeota archaeon]MBT4367972.1 hypothetical protein [Candidatus Woesearchaeota archaeon]MBT4712460.1 hypothetical protein [Candidatus Woesearchaeota archaeon]MBT6639373.1 hypothetical protein [Candidatus Woesearchaeota archaeon]MBT7133545.1 hypothetical protein [Candidatus Woesearchaeota archaeon]
MSYVPKMYRPRFRLRSIGEATEGSQSVFLEFKPEVTLVDATEEITWFYSMHTESDKVPSGIQPGGASAYCRIGDQGRDPSLKVWAVEPRREANQFNLMKERAITQEEFDAFTAYLSEVTKPRPRR